jgi:hypothetical protein
MALPNSRGEVAAAVRLLFWAIATQLAMSVLDQGVGVLIRSAHQFQLYPALNIARQLSELAVDVLEALALYRLARVQDRAAAIAWAAFGLAIVGAGTDLVTLTVSVLPQGGFGSSPAMHAFEVLGEGGYWAQMALMLAALWMAVRAEGIAASRGLAIAAVVALGVQYGADRSVNAFHIGWDAAWIVYTGLAWTFRILMLIALGSAGQKLRSGPIWPSQPGAPGRLPGR